MKHITVLLLSVILLAACEAKNTAPVPREKMKEILLDIHMAEAYSLMVTDSLHFLREKNKDSLAVFYNDVLKHHGLSKDKFLKVLDWYRRHPEELDSVYAAMLPELNRLEGVYPK